MKTYMYVLGVTEMARGRAAVLHSHYIHLSSSFKNYELNYEFDIYLMVNLDVPTLNFLMQH